MLSSISNSPALWGFLGAIIYTAPRFSACYWQCKDTDAGWGRCFFDAVVMLIVGTLSAYLLAEWVQNFLQRKGALELRAISSVIGLLSNRIMPKVVDGAEGWFSKRWPGTST